MGKLELDRRYVASHQYLAASLSSLQVSTVYRAGLVGQKCTGWQGSTFCALHRLSPY